MSNMENYELDFDNLANFVELDSNNVVVNTLVINKVDCSDEDETVGINFCKQHFKDGNYLRITRDPADRRKSPVINDIYNPKTNNFYSPIKQIDSSTFTYPYYGLFTGKNIDRKNNEINSIFPLSGDFIKFTENHYLYQTEQECIDKSLELELLDINTKQSLYVNLPNGNSLCLIYRNASSIFTSLISKTFFNASIEAQQSAFNRKYLEESIEPIGMPHAIIRDPIDRFISTYALNTGGIPMWLDVDNFINWLLKQDKGTLNLHLRPQTILIGNYNNIKCYDFATELEEAAKDLGLTIPLPIFNDTDPSKKPNLTEQQIAKLKEYYSEDVNLYNKVKK